MAKKAVNKTAISQRAIKRLNLAEEVCREVRYQFSHYGRILDTDSLHKIWSKWFKSAGKKRHNLPKNRE